MALSAPVVWLPERALAPLQAPDAVQEEARALDQVSVLTPPGLTVCGLAESVTVGRNCATACVADVPNQIAATASRKRVMFFMARS